MKTVSSNRESGQAVIEYILVLIVVVSICLGVMWQFNDAFRKFTNSYFGNYLACLLELGELPSLGSGEGGQCNEEYEPFNLANGRAKQGNAVGSTTGDDDDASGKRASDRDKSDDDSSGSGSTAGRSGSTERSSQFGSNLSGRSGGRGGPASTVVGKVVDQPYTGSTDASSKTSTQLTALNQKGSTTLTDQAGGMIDPFQERKVKGAPKTVARDSRDEALRNKKARVEIQRKVANTQESEKDKEFGFGDLLRWFLIAAIIIAVVIFLGGQALQISKSWE